MKTNLDNSTLMKMAYEALKGKWPLAIGTFVVYILIISFLKIASEYSTFASLINLIIGGPLALGVTIFSINISRNQNPKLDQILQGFNFFGTSLVAYLLIMLFTLLWTLLLIIPGIIAGISYSMTFYIMADDNSIGAMEAIDKSKKMMDGYKLKFFYLTIKFLGLIILSAFTLGIGLLWIIPYINICIAKFYDDIKENNIANETIV